jgi:hypothetical protein
MLIEVSITLKKRVDDKLLDIIQPLGKVEPNPLSVSTSLSVETFSDASSDDNPPTDI